MDRGALVPDDLVITMIVERMRQPDANHGVLLDGFPRNVAQAQALDKRARRRGARPAPWRCISKCRSTCWSSARRAAGRAAPARRPTTTASIRHARQGVCDLDGGELYQREDDRLDVVSERIKVYIQDTVPVVDYYRERGILREIDGTQRHRRSRRGYRAAAGGGGVIEYAGCRRRRGVVRLCCPALDDLNV